MNDDAVNHNRLFFFVLKFIQTFWIDFGPERNRYRTKTQIDYIMESIDELYDSKGFRNGSKKRSLFLNNFVRSMDNEDDDDDEIVESNRTESNQSQFQSR